jgi:Flp pilus assembly pilin Flp
MKAKLNLLAMRVWHRWKSEEAQDLIEYALLLGFISLVVVASIKPFGHILYNYYLYLKGKINTLPIST